MLSGFLAYVSLGKAKVYHEERVLVLISRTYEEVLWLKIAMDVSTFVYGLCPRDHLESQVLKGVQREFVTTKVKELLQGWTLQIHDHHIESTFHARPMHLTDAS